MKQTKLSEILSKILKNLIVKYDQSISSHQIYQELYHYFWQSLPPTIRFQVAWELILYVYQKKDVDVSQLRMQKSIETYQRQPWSE